MDVEYILLDMELTLKPNHFISIFSSHSTDSPFLLVVVVWLVVEVLVVDVVDVVDVVRVVVVVLVV